MSDNIGRSQTDRQGDKSTCSLILNAITTTVYNYTTFQMCFHAAMVE